MEDSKMSRKFCMRFLVIFLLLGVGSLLINVTVDPYNFFNGECTDFIPLLNERNIKTMYLSNNRDVFNSVMIGSSRSSYIDASKFEKYSMFNYSVSGISIDEYLPYLKFYEKTQGTPKLIILSLDFYGSNQSYENLFEPESIIENSQSKFKFFLDYVKIKNACVSLRMLMSNANDYQTYYTRSLVKKRSINEGFGLNEEIIKRSILELRLDFKNYIIRSDYKEKLIQIRRSFPHSKIIVLVCPIHCSLMQGINEMVDPFYYQKWTEEICEVFGHCHDFNKYKLIVEDRTNFFDGSHFYPFVGDKIISILSNSVE